MNAAILEFLDRLGVAGFFAVGNSLGGYLAWNLAIEVPERVEKLILLSPAAYPLDNVPWPVKISTNPFNAMLFRRVAPRFLVEATVRQLFGRPERVEDRLVQRHYDILRRPGNRESYVQIFRVLKSHSRDFPDKVKNIRCPVLLMWGARDRWIPATQAVEWRRDLPEVETILYPDVGHLPQEEIPEKSVHDALDFLHRP